MKHNDQETAELTRDVIGLSRELSALKREHKHLREAVRELCDWASEAREFMPGVDDPQDDGYAVAHHLRESEKAVRAALDSTSSELSKQGPELSWLKLENENLKKNLAALEKHLEKTK